MADGDARKLALECFRAEAMALLPRIAQELYTAALLLHQVPAGSSPDDPETLLFHTTALGFEQCIAEPCARRRQLIAEALETVRGFEAAKTLPGGDPPSK